MITVKSLRQSKPTEPWQVRVDRPSVLSNKFYMKRENQEERKKVCAKYSIWLSNQMKMEGLAKLEMDKLKEIYKQYGKLELFCWCKPKQCHGDSIKEYIEKN